MKLLGAFIFAVCAMGQTCSSIVTAVDKHTALISFVAPSAAPRTRALIGTAPGTYTRTAGTEDDYASGTALGVSISGLEANTTYYALPAALTSGNVVVCEGPEQTFTTGGGPDEATVAALPDFMVGYTGARPPVTGTVRTVVQPDCSDLPGHMADAVPGDEVRVTSLTACASTAIPAFTSTAGSAFRILRCVPADYTPGTYPAASAPLCQIRIVDTMSFLISKWWWIEGFEITYAPIASVGDHDPEPFGSSGNGFSWVYMRAGTEHIMLRGNRFVTPGYPQRALRLCLDCAGDDIAWVDNDLGDFSPWRPMLYNAGTLTGGATIAMTGGGTAAMGNKTCAVPAWSTGTLSGSGGARVEIDQSCVVRVFTPASVSCTNCTNVVSAVACPGDANAPAWTGFRLAWGCITAGVANMAALSRSDMVRRFTEGGIAFALTNTSNRWLIRGNKIRGAGSGALIFTEPFSGAGATNSTYPYDLTIENNDIENPNPCDTAAFIAGGVPNFTTTSRHPIEFKIGQRLTVRNNRIAGSCAIANNADGILANTNAPQGFPRQQLTDVLIAGNRFENVVHGATIGSALLAIGASRACVRCSLIGNLFSIDSSRVSVSFTARRGYGGRLNHTVSPATIRGNTFSGFIGGTDPVLLSFDAGSYGKGVRIADNIFAGNATGGNFGFLGQNRYSIANAPNTAGLGAAGLAAVGADWVTNTIIGQNQSGSTPMTAPQTVTFCASAPSSTCPAGATISERLTAGGLLADWSPVVTGSSAGRGADVAHYVGRILGAQAARASSTSATVSWSDPAGGGRVCAVDRSSDGGSTYAGAVSSTSPASLTGLSAGTTYTVRVRCGWASATTQVRI